MLGGIDAELFRQLADCERQDGDRQRSERGANAVEARFEAAFTRAPIGMALVDMNGRWLQVNICGCS